jgi:hypothetical protein
LIGLKESGLGLILGHRPNSVRNFDWLSFTPLWSPSPVLQFLTPGRVNGINFRALTKLQRSYNKSKFRQEAFQDKATTTTVVINAH